MSKGNTGSETGLVKVDNSTPAIVNTGTQTVDTPEEKRTLAIGERQAWLVGYGISQVDGKDTYTILCVSENTTTGRVAMLTTAHKIASTDYKDVKFSKVDVETRHYCTKNLTINKQLAIYFMTQVKGYLTHPFYLDWMVEFTRHGWVKPHEVKIGEKYGYRLVDGKPTR